MEKDVHIGNEWCKILRVYSKQMRITTRRVENTMKKVQGRIHACERGFQR
jgi:hypothetical protein